MTAAIVGLFLLFAIVGPLVLYALVRRERTGRRPVDRREAERIARRDGDDVDERS